MAELAAWLERIGLGHYADAFAEAAIDLDVLPDLSEADLADLGVRLGDRKRLLKAVAAPVHDAGDAGAARSDGTLSWSPSSACQLTVTFVVVLADRRHDVAALDLAIAHPDFVDGLSTKRRPVTQP